MQALNDDAPAGRELGRLAQLTSAWSLRAKVLASALVATHVPLLVTMAYLLFVADRPSRELVLGMVLTATVVGAALVVWSLSRLLGPLALASRSLLEAQAFHDPLTGLLNRRAAESQLTHSLALLERSSVPMCVALLNVDRFKRVNASLGHVGGDRVLSGVAATVRQHARRKSDWAARWGGDELLLALYTDLRTATAILERLRADILEGSFAGERAPVTVSIGVTTCLPGEDVDGCLERADSALYRAKRGGRNRVMAAE